MSSEQEIIEQACIDFSTGKIRASVAMKELILTARLEVVYITT